MLVRILTGLVGIPVFLAILYAGKWPLFALVAGMGLVGFHEYARMWRVKEVRVAYGLGSLFSLLLLFWAQVMPGNSAILGLLLALTPLATLTWLILRYEEHTILDALVSVAGVVYVGWLLSHLLLLRGLGQGTGFDLGLKWVAMAFFCTWAADSLAYFTGMAFGRRKLAPKISPGKSVEGFMGGTVAAILVGGIWGGAFLGMRGWQGGLVGLAIGLVSVAGDLAESALKRYVGVKDSGSLLPGHGGVLDRFDSSLFVLPVVYYLARLFFLG